MQGPRWPLFLLILIVYGLDVVVVDYWDMYVPWVEQLVKSRLYPIFLSGVELPDIHEYSAG